MIYNFIRFDRGCAFSRIGREFGEIEKGKEVVKQFCAQSLS